MRHGKLFSCFLVFLFFLIGFPEAARAEGGKFIVLPFKNVKAVRAMEFLSAALPAEISRRLENYNKFHPALSEKIFPDYFDFERPLSSADAVALAAAHGAKFIFTGEFYGPNWKARFVINLYEVKDGAATIRTVEREVQLDGKEIREFAALDEMLGALLGAYNLLPDESVWRRLTARPIKDHYGYVFLGRGIAAWRGIGREQNLDAAEEFFKIATRVEPNFAFAHRLLALSFRDAGDDRAAVRRLEEAAGLDQKDYVSRMALSGIYAANGETAKALEVAKEATAARPFEDEGLYQVGELALRLGYREIAESALTRATALNPGHIRARHLLAKIHAANGNGKKLIAELRVIVKLTPKDTDTEFALAAAYRRFGDESRAVETLKSIIARDRRKVIAYKFLGDIYRAAGDNDNAVAIYSIGRRLAPNDPRFSFALGDAYFAKKNYATAEGHYRKALRHNKTARYAENNLAVVFAALGDKFAARTILENLGERAPNYFLGRYNLAALYISSADPKMAVNILRELYSIEPQSEEVCFALGVAYFLSGDKSRARELFAEATRIDPDDRLAAADLLAVDSANIPHKEVILLLDAPYPDASRLGKMFLRARLADEDVALNRDSFYAGARDLSAQLERADSELAKSKKKKRVCPVQAVGNGKTIIHSYRDFIVRGRALESVLEILRFAETSGEIKSLTSDAASEIGRLAAAYHRALADLREMRLTVEEELPSELEYWRCAQDILWRGTASAAQDEGALSRAPVSEPSSVPASFAAVDLGVVFSVDNRGCAVAFDVFVDGRLLGRVAAAQKMSFRVIKGYHTLCILPADSAAKCGALGAIRSGYFQSGFSFVNKCK
ncbi:MAG: tetratricopeptide repeat protein [Patescibacteria group bacterium]